MSVFFSINDSNCFFGGDVNWEKLRYWRLGRGRYTAPEKAGLHPGYVNYIKKYRAVFLFCLFFVFYN